MNLKCPKCNADLEIPDSQLGRSFGCPKCGKKIFIIPGTTEEQPEKKPHHAHGFPKFVKGAERLELFKRKFAPIWGIAEMRAKDFFKMLLEAESENSLKDLGLATLPPTKEQFYEYTTAIVLPKLLKAVFSEVFEKEDGGSPLQDKYGRPLHIQSDVIEAFAAAFTLKLEDLFVSYLKKTAAQDRT